MKKVKAFFVLLVCTAASTFAQDDVKYDQYGMEVKSQPVKSEMRDGILVFESKDAAYKFWFDARVQADFATFFGEDKDYDRIGSGASIRRARFAVKAQVTPDWYGEVDMDIADGMLELKDALVRYDGFKHVEIQVGNFKENFSMQRNTSSRYLQFMERPMVTYLAPSRSIGLEVKYSTPLFWTAGGVFFQPLGGSEEAINAQDNNKDFGRNSGISYTGKIVLRPLHNKELGIHLGGALSYRTPKSTDAPSDWGGVRFNTRNSTYINRKKYLDTDVIRGADHSLLYTGEVAAHYKGLRIESAYIGTKVVLEDDSPEVNKKDKTFGGWYVQGGYLLFGGKQRYDYSGAKFNRVARGQKWGDVELVGRYEYLDLNDHKGGVYGGSAQAYALGLSFWVNNNVKIMLNYQYTDNDRYANGKNKLFIGHDADGKPTKDYSKVVESKGKAGVDYSMLAMRFEIAF